MPTMKDVAKRAGVSTATVSHVINSTRFVSPEIVARVQKAMRETDYQPNYVAHSLRTQKTKTIGLILPILMDESSNVYFMQMMMGIEAALEVEGYSAILGNTHENIHNERTMLENFQKRLVDGLIIAPVNQSHRFARKLVKQKPVVFVDREPLDLPGVDCVVNDAVYGSEAAVAALIAQGHRKIGLLSGVLGYNTMADLRVKGYMNALRRHDITPDSRWMVEGESTREEGYRMMKSIFENTDVTAVFIASNIMAMGAIEYTNQLPHKRRSIYVTIFDDYEWVNTCAPPVTTVRQDAYQLGKTAAHLILERIANPEGEPRIIRLPTQLIVRGDMRALPSKG